MTDAIRVHSCGYHCQNPACIKEQRDELLRRVEALRSAVTALHCDRDAAIREIDSLKAELAATQQAVQREPWQPIESAPKDGTWVLLCGGITDEDDCGGVTVHRPVVAFYGESFYEDGWWFSYWDSDWRTDYNGPTHWMRLPAPPKEQPCADAIRSGE